MASESLNEYCRRRLEELREEGRLRTVPTRGAARYDLSGNDYLGLAAASDAVSPQARMTSSASRLLAADQDEYTLLEADLSRLYGRPALLFNSGYHANTGCVSALADKETLLVADKLVHASIIDGLLLGGTDFQRFRHNDMKNLRRILERNAGRRIVVITESVFSMDGDAAPLRELVALKREFPGVALYVDEAHAFGVFGRRGLGLCEELGLINDIDIIIGTFGKAGASMGAFAIAAQEVHDFLLNTARSFIFSTALPPAQAAWSRRMLGRITAAEAERENLKRISRRFRGGIEEITGRPIGSVSQIVPLMIGDAERAVAFSRRLEERGVRALAIRRPTVPVGTERIRFSLSAAMTDEDVDKVLEAVREVWNSEHTRYRWLSRDSDKRLILIFAGWGTDWRLYADVSRSGWSVLVCYDFAMDDFPAGMLDGFETIYLYAWSLGVYQASRMLAPFADRITAAFAINGTEWPADDTRGIPRRIFHDTYACLDSRRLDKFRRRMFSSREEYQSVLPHLPEEADIRRLAAQLERIYDANEAGDLAPAPFWTRAYVGTHDLIFPAEAQRNAWENHPSGVETATVSRCHYIPIEEIINSTISSYSRVATKFREALGTYDRHAVAQRIIADKLTALIADNLPATGLSALEIGQGSGLFTRMYAPMTVCRRIDFIDLYQTPHVPAAPVTNYHVGDAELFLEESTARYDLILSASAVQWMPDLRRFLSLAATHVAPGGMLAFSTFVRGNLSEFDALRPNPMLYHTAEEIRRMAEEFFTGVEVDTEEIRIDFPTAKEALLHLRHTGVTGTSTETLSLQQLMDAIPVDDNGRRFLTYRPIYVIAHSE